MVSRRVPDSRAPRCEAVLMGKYAQILEAYTSVYMSVYTVYVPTSKIWPTSVCVSREV